MAKLISVRPAGNKGYLTLVLLNGDAKAIYTVPASIYEAAGAPLRGEEIPAAALALFRTESERYASTRTALNLLAYQDNSEKQLRDKLRRRGFSGAVASAAARDMVSLGYLDERRQLERAVLAAANTKLHGSHRILAELSLKGYTKEDIREVIRTLCDEGAIDFSANFRRLLERRRIDPQDTATVQKWRYNYGYDRHDGEA